MSLLPVLASRVPQANLSKVPKPPKRVDPELLTVAYRAWREQVIARAGGRCQATDAVGRPCPKAAPRHRMFADHVVERKDGGALLDPDNGMCLCGAHHTKKTMRERARRAQG